MSIDTQEILDLGAQLKSLPDIAHPALARLQRDLAAGDEADQLITSYDRMHHRHNRS